jgi:hypothetical protein
MTVDVAAVERLVADVTRQFQEGLQQIAAAAARESELERKRLSDESLALAKERARLEEARQHLRLERLRLELAPPSSEGGQELQDSVCTKDPELSTPMFHTRELLNVPPSYEGKSLHGAQGGSARADVDVLHLSPPPSVVAVSGAPRCLSAHVPRDCAVAWRGSIFAVLPAERPDAGQLGHDLWNHTVEVPDGWEVVSAKQRDFDHVLAAMTRQSWGAMVLGVRNAREGFDAYYTPLFQAGNYEGRLCQADVDWIEAAAESPKRFRMTYSGLRLLIRSQAPRPSAAFGGR